jgi:predicted HTH transcriptional regulator
VAIFDDRLEIDNPGMLLSGLTTTDIQQGHSKLRNRVIGRVFKELRYIEQWGSGILRAAAECRKAGLPEPQFEEFAFRFRATLSLVAERAIRSRMTVLVERGLVTAVGTSSRDPQRKYYWRP